MRLFGWRGLLGLAVVTTAMVFGVGTASAAFHGIGLTKGCVSPVKIGDPYACSVQILNVVDQGHDTVRVTGLNDTVKPLAQPPDAPVPSGEILPSIGLVFSSPTVTCTGGSGAGTPGSPRVGATSCLLPFGTSITTTGFTHYTTQASDFDLPLHRLTDRASINWNNTCQFDPDNDCTTLPQTAGAGSSSVVEKLPSSTATDIHNASHQTVTVVEARSTVHDFVTVTGQPGRPVPSGNVNIDWFLNGDCSGAPAVNSGSIGPLNGSGQFDATGFAFTVNAPGFRAFKAHYGGDATYLPSDGACEPLRVVDANVQITPDGVNRVGATHVFTGHVNVNDGNGFTNAPAGTIIAFLIHSGPGGFVGNDYCLTIGSTGSCTVSILSLTTGVNVVSAHTIVAAAGLSLTRHSDGINGNSGVAIKRWVNAKIAITPDATNRVGAPHTFTVTLMKDAGDGNGFVAASGEHVDVNLNDSLGAVHTAPTGSCTGAGANTNASGQCTITFASNSTGKVTGHAFSTLSVAGSAPFTVATDGQAPNSGDAVKTYVNAKIAIAPDATNEVGAPHTFTVTLQKDLGNGAGFVAAAGEHVDFTLTDSNGAVHTAPTGSCTGAGANTNASGQCTITFTSNSSGKVTAHASSVVSIGGAASFAVATDGQAPNSGDAVKTFVDANIQITPNGVNRVGDSHVFTAHVNINAGDGNGFVNAPNGTSISFTIDSGPGGFTTATPCTTAAGTGSCQITLSSAVTGVSTVSAHTTLSVGGVSLTRHTNGTGANSGPATKRWVNAKIAIAPNATNEVGAPHTFTVTLMKDAGDGSGFVAAAGEHVNFTLTNSNGASFILNAASSTCDDAGANTNASGQCLIVVNSNTAGKVTAHASSTLSVAGSAAFTVQTDGVSPNSGDAVKTWVDANIQITPDGVNRVGDSHVFTAHVNINAGDGNGFVNAPNGTSISFTIDSGPGGFTTATPCTTAAGTGSCQITLSSAVTGVSTVSAHTTLSVGGVSLTRHTNGTGANSGPATKRWVNAKIAIAPNATNEVGAPHTFTVTLMKDAGDGSGFVAAAGEHVNFTLTNSNGASFILNAASSTCDDAGANTNASGQCLIVVNSNTAGKVTAHASSTLSVAGSAAFTVQTDGVSPNSGDAVKTWVDAKISITPNGVNPVGATHTFTGHVEINAGDGNGFVNAPNGTSISFTIDSGPGSFQTATPCTTAGGTGSCTIDLKSLVAGTTIVSAHSTLSVGGVSLTRHTNGTGANSGPATKQWVAAKIAIAPDATNEVGVAHTFTVTLQKDPGTGYVAAAGEHVDFTLTNSNGATFTLNAASSTCDDAGANTNASGQCTIVINSNTAGKVTAHASSTLSVAGSANITVETDGVAPNSGDAVKTYVDANIQITPQTANNPVSTNHTLTGHVNVNAGAGAGYVNAPNGTVITFALQNSGGATASFVGSNSCTTAGGTGSCTVVINSSTTGTTTINATTTLSVGGVSLTRTTGDGKVGDSADANKLWADATARTDIHDSAHNVLLTGHPGLVVHDKVFVERTAGTPAAVPNPTGNVVFHRYTTIDCTGAATDETKALAADGTAESSDFTAAANMSYKASYNGDANYPARDGACEPLSVTLPCPAGLFLAGTGAGANAADLNIAYDQFPAPNDNSYGVNAVGWPSGHTFGNLTGSDKAGFQIVRPNGTIALSFNIDSISSTAVSAAAPSGYASLGPFGGDGSIVTNSVPALTNDPAKITWDTAIARNLNKTGYFAAGTQVVGKPATAGCPAASAAAGTCSDLLVDSPKTLNTTDSYVLKTPNPWAAVYSNPEYAAMGLTPSQLSQVVSTVNGWNFHNTFFVTLKQAYLTSIGFDFANFTFGATAVAGKWSVVPNLTVLHNSPAKPCPPTPPGPAQLAVTNKTSSGKTVSITIKNTGGDDAIMNQLALSWPQVPNGNLTTIKLDGDTVYSNATGVASPQTLVVPPLTATASKRTVEAGRTEVLVLTFKNNVDTNLTHYTGTASWDNGTPNLTLLP